MKTYIDDIEFKVEYSYTPAVHGVKTLRNGDPGWPDEPAQIEDIELTAIFEDCELAGQIFKVEYSKLPEKTRNQIYNEICEFEADKAADGYAEAHEREDD